LAAETPARLRRLAVATMARAVGRAPRDVESLIDDAVVRV
jgi:hypothetical protein